jgi:hypothetical protein
LQKPKSNLDETLREESADQVTTGILLLLLEDDSMLVRLAGI